MQPSFFLCHEPPLYIGSQRVLVALECRATHIGTGAGRAAVLHLTLFPVALVFLDGDRGRVLMAAGFTLARLEELLLEGAGEALDV